MYPQRTGPDRADLARLTLPEFYRQRFEPEFLADATARTRKEYRATLGYWLELTRNPAVGQTTAADLAHFKRNLLEPTEREELAGDPQLTLFDLCDSARPLITRRRPLARATINKHLRHLSAIFNRLGPPGPRNREGLGVLDFVPWTRPVKQPRRLPRPAAAAAVGAIYAAASTAGRPELQGVAPSDWWRALIVAAYTTGFRRGGLMRLPAEAVDYQAREIRLPAEADKCGQERCKPISMLLLRHLLKIRAAYDLVFAWPHSESTWYRQWRSLQVAAGVKPQIRFHQLKAACGTVLAASGASAWLIQKRLDHSSLATSQSYINASGEERAAVETMPVPDAFLQESFGS